MIAAPEPDRQYKNQGEWIIMRMFTALRILALTA
jgi:hypothetical protein